MSNTNTTTTTPIEAAFHAYASAYLKSLGETLYTTKAADVWHAVEALQKCQGTIWLIGNGGSASLASHMATDLQLAGLRAVALTDVAAITTHANDNSFEFSFVGQLDVLAGPGDVLVAISGSGKSPNIVRATAWAMSQGLTVVGLTGFTGGALKVHHLVHVPSMHMGQAQDAQQIMLHIVAYWLMEQMKTRPLPVIVEG